MASGSEASLGFQLAWSPPSTKAVLLDGDAAVRLHRNLVARRIQCNHLLVEDRRRHGLIFTQQAQEEMLGPDVRVS
jgi:hypothetical protein